VHRGIHVIEEFNKVFRKYGKRYEYVCKWDDDLLLIESAVKKTLMLLDKDQDAVGAGLFSSQYGAPFILMANQETQGFRGAFQRFYVYRTKNWGEVDVKYDGVSGDPDQAHQEFLEGRKIQLHFPHVHLDHRAVPNDNFLPHHLRFRLLELLPMKINILGEGHAYYWRRC